mmetsp:Transcript_108980/g.308184  ORF Transcript_108980/g.308184 Transcript_108980/m.308184 type:complete len:240 (-) Transcript_108980:395-1114(-)
MQRWEQGGCQLCGSAAPQRAGRIVLQDPAPGQVDARGLHGALPRHAVPVVALAEALHGAEVAVLERELRDLCRLVLRRELEDPRRAERERNDERVPVERVEQRLVVRVPAHRLRAVVVVVRVAGVRLVLEAAGAADGLRDLPEPADHGHRVELQAAVLVAAAAALDREPGRAAREHELVRRRAPPLDLRLQRRPPLAEHVGAEGVLAVRDKRPPVLIVQHRGPAGAGLRRRERPWAAAA